MNCLKLVIAERGRETERGRTAAPLGRVMTSLMIQYCRSDDDSWMIRDLM